MKFSATIAALAAVAVAAPGHIDERDVSPASVTAALIQVLPSSIISVALTNPAEASSLIVDSFKTGTPAWFGSLPTDVQSYLVTVDQTLVSTGSPASATGGAKTTSQAALATGASGSNGTASTGKYNNSTVTSTGTVSKTSTKSSGSAATGGSGSSSSSSAGASMPTAIIGSGIAGFVGILGMLAL